MRRLVCETIHERPGIHYRELLRTVGLSNGTLAFHLDHLERGGYVRSFRVHGRRRLFPVGLRPQPQDFLITERQRGIVRFLRESPGASQHEVRQALALSRSSVSYNLRALVDLRIVEARWVRGSPRYFSR